MSGIIQLCNEVAKLVYVILPFTFVFSLLGGIKAILKSSEGEKDGFNVKTGTGGDIEQESLPENIERESLSEEGKKEPFPEEIKYGFFAAVSLLLLLAPLMELCYFY